ncbi:hypothetical protein [Kordia sp.]|uniref:hypothetical protein n=1 Tax=Kordia sp. TaxID=1965332 RepID=UPI0025B897FE|nr:hypothetical protein [Kordia sp.]MCH2193113.1 hypothetical protein [Kordia sp.]
MKKILKILGKFILGIALTIVLLFAVLYFMYNEPLPKGTEGSEADAMATKMLTALNHEAYKNTRYLSWTFRGAHHYVWDKDQYQVLVSWDDIKVDLNLKTPNTSTVTVNGNKITNHYQSHYFEKALSYFNNDSFWLVAPYKVFDEGATRSIVSNKAGEKGLLVTYSSGGTTPGDSYLWFLDENGRPKGYQMWVDILPIGGLYASWDHWQTMKNGIPLASLHTLLFLDIHVDSIKAWN